MRRRVTFPALARSGATVTVLFAVATLFVSWGLESVSPCAWGADVPAGSFVFDGTVRSIAHVDGATYVGGEFTQEQRPTGAGLVVAVGGSGSPDPAAFPRVAGTVNAVASDGAGGWYVGGDFSSVGGVARSNLARIKPDGTVDLVWNPNPTGGVSALAVTGSTVYAGGGFTSIGGQSRRNLAALDVSTGSATSWNPNPDGSVLALAVSELTVYAGGDFTSIGGQSRNRLAALDASTGNAASWNPNANGRVSALTSSGPLVYAGGGFTSIGGQSRRGLAALGASTGGATNWNPNPTGGVSALAVTGSTVYAGGGFTSIGGQSRRNLAALDVSTGSATSWNPNPDGVISALAVTGSTVYAGGGFTSIGGQSRHGIAALDASTASATSWDPNPNSAVTALAVSGSSVYVGGSFSGAGPVLATVRGLAKLAPDGSLQADWNPDADGRVQALAVSGSTLYAGGYFNSIGGQSRRNLAALDVSTGSATSWNPAPDSDIDALAVSGSTVYAGGHFTSIGGQSRNHLAALDVSTGSATSWNPNPDGFDLSALAVSGSTLYVGGSFTSIGGQARYGLAAIDVGTGNPTAWNPNSVFGSTVRALVASDSTVRVAGGFGGFSGGQPRAGLAALSTSTGNATAWDPGLSMTANPPDVVALAVSGSTVYAGGYFASIGGQSRTNLAALDASTGSATSWNPAPNGGVLALAVSGSTVYAGGSFTSIGGQATGTYAQVTDPPPDTVPPTISVTKPTEGEHFALHQSVGSQYACDDGSGSGVASCAGPSTIDTSSAGGHSFTVSATDRASNTASKTVHYFVDEEPTVVDPPHLGLTLSVSPNPRAGVPFEVTVTAPADARFNSRVHVYALDQGAPCTASSQGPWVLVTSPSSGTAPIATEVTVTKPGTYVYCAVRTNENNATDEITYSVAGVTVVVGEPRISIALDVPKTVRIDSAFSVRWTSDSEVDLQGTRYLAIVHGGCPPSWAALQRLSYAARIEVFDQSDLPSGSYSSTSTLTMTVPGAFNVCGYVQRDYDDPAPIVAAAVSFVAVDRTKPTISSARATRSGSLTVIVNEKSTLSVVVQATDKGRKVGKKCVKATPSNRRKAACVRYLSFGTFAAGKVKAGSNLVKLPRSVSGKRLRKGTYRLTIAATDAAGNRSKARTVLVRVTK